MTIPSLQKVPVTCVTCGEPFTLLRRALHDQPKCPSCRRTKGPFDGDGSRHLVDDEARALSPYSFEKVRARCDACGSVYSRRRRAIRDGSVCVPCSRTQIDHGRLQTKRQATIAALYPEGLPLPPGGYGVAANALGERLEAKLGRPLEREHRLTGGKSIDLYDPVLKVGIEYCGLHWHHELSPTPRGRRYHREKLLAARAEGITLITVFEDEVLQHGSAVEGRLLAILGHADRHLGAREARAGEVMPLDARAFLARHHVQGPPSAISVAWGLRVGAELVAVLTLGPHHRGGSVVLNRLCFAAGVRVAGGFARLLSRAVTWCREQGIERLITWSDERWSEGAVYAATGFTLAAELPPDYAYVDARAPRRRWSKQSQRKRATACPAGKTELEWARERGLSRIWDCGRRRWELVL